MFKGSMKVLLFVIMLGALSPVYSVCSIDTSTMCSGDIDDRQNILLNKDNMFLTPYINENYKDQTFDYNEIINERNTGINNSQVCKFSFCKDLSY